MDVRTRFGIVPPPPLDSMRQGDLELSDIALPDTKNDSVKIAEPDEGLLHHISGPMHFDAAHRRIGLYWQSYGVSATHSAPDASPVATRRRAEEGAGEGGATGPTATTGHGGRCQSGTTLRQTQHHCCNAQTCGVHVSGTRRHRWVGEG